MTTRRPLVTDLPFSRQFALLLDRRRLAALPPSTPADTARATGIPLQTLLYLLDGTSSSPRLSTARALCVGFDISLDYFDCATEEECQRYLAQRWLRNAPEAARQLADEAQRLSPRGQHNILSILEWIRRAAR
jgi:hypothetical protein